MQDHPPVCACRQPPLHLLLQQARAQPYLVVQIRFRAGLRRSRLLALRCTRSAASCLSVPLLTHSDDSIVRFDRLAAVDAFGLHGSDHCAYALDRASLLHYALRPLPPASVVDQHCSALARDGFWSRRACGDDCLLLEPIMGRMGWCSTYHVVNVILRPPISAAR